MRMLPSLLTVTGFSGSLLPKDQVYTTKWTWAWDFETLLWVSAHGNRNNMYNPLVSDISFETVPTFSTHMACQYLATVFVLVAFDVKIEVSQNGNRQRSSQNWTTSRPIHSCFNDSWHDHTTIDHSAGLKIASLYRSPLKIFGLWQSESSVRQRWMLWWLSQGSTHWAIGFLKIKYKFCSCLAVMNQMAKVAK